MGATPANTHVCLAAKEILLVAAWKFHHQKKGIELYAVPDLLTSLRNSHR